MTKQTSNTFTSKVVTCSTSSEDEDDKEKFVCYLNNTRNIWRVALYLLFTSILDVGNNCSTITKRVKRKLQIEKLFIDSRTSSLM